jgi:hypothetical protein
MVGTVLMFVGFLQAGTLRDRPRIPGAGER